ncbi:hypothetical protein ACI1UG_10540 [Lactococcus garvieae]|uniref:hypothetical protein n=1 Tax=Lactococcus garvieae TaxID=1363 RepID=UPI0038544A26
MSNQSSESKSEKFIPSEIPKLADNTQNKKLNRLILRNLDNTGIVLSTTNLNKETSSTNLISFTYSIKTTSDKGINKGDKIVLNIPSTGLNYDTLDVSGLPSYFLQYIDVANNQIIFTTTEDVIFNSEAPVTFSLTGNPTRTAENTDVPKVILYPASSSYILNNLSIVKLN